MSKTTKQSKWSFTEQDFWQIIENAWVKIKTVNKIRLKCNSHPLGISQELILMLQYFVLPEITKTLKALNKEPLIAFRRVLDQKLDDIDSEHLYDFFFNHNWW